MKKIIFLTGIHGVGKGYISNCIKDKIDVSIYTASDLIRKTGNKSDCNKKVLNINKNQEILSFAIETFIKEEKFILDGHTCLLNKDGKIETISLSSLSSLIISAIIFVCNDVESIQKRLYKRDHINYSYDDIKEFQKAEHDNSKKLAKQLNIPFLCFKNGDDLQKLIDYIKKVEVIL